MKRTVILANGILHQSDLMRQRLYQYDPTFVVAADGGSQLAEVLDLRLDVIIGDLDSFPAEQRSRLEAAGIKFVVAPAHKDETDLELALLYACKQGAEKITVIGLLGGRADMTLANLLLLTHPDLENSNLKAWHGNQTLWIIRPPGDGISGAPGDTLSLIPLGGPAEGITTQHLAYPLKDETLSTGPARGISNVMEAEQARVELEAGMLLAIHTPGRA